MDKDIMIYALKKVSSGKSLSSAEAEEVMGQILSGSAKPEQVGALLLSLRAKKESASELVGFAKALRRQAILVSTDSPSLMDLCGTGGDGAHTFNISTTTSFVVAAAGQPLAKHGNRAVSSACGSSDVLDVLGVPPCLTPEDVRSQLSCHGLAFLFAPAFHPVLKTLASLRKNLGVRTAFNLLGPLLNPARVKRQLIGVFDPSLVRTLAETLEILGSEEVMIVCGFDGLDEVSLTAATHVAHLKRGSIHTYNLHPEDHGLSLVKTQALTGGDAVENAKILESILDGETGPRRDVVLLNAAAALVVGGTAEDMNEGIFLAKRAIDSNAARDLLQKSRNDFRSAI